NNDLSSLPEDIFDGLSNLQVLWLSSNNLSNLPEDIFDGLSNLQE
ncbi:MAG: leucine-rich repeat domain-containing protein, partial [Aphanocapsa feldmannii 277cV]